MKMESNERRKLQLLEDPLEEAEDKRSKKYFPDGRAIL